MVDPTVLTKTAWDVTGMTIATHSYHTGEVPLFHERQIKWEDGEPLASVEALRGCAKSTRDVEQLHVHLRPIGDVSRRGIATKRLIVVSPCYASELLRHMNNEELVQPKVTSTLGLVGAINTCVNRKCLNPGDDIGNKFRFSRTRVDDELTVQQSTGCRFFVARFLDENR